MRKRIREIVIVVVVVKTFHIDFRLSTLKEKKVRCENLFGCTTGSPVSILTVQCNSLHPVVVAVVIVVVTAAVAIVVVAGKSSQFHEHFRSWLS